MSLNEVIRPLDCQVQRTNDPLLLCNPSFVWILCGRKGSGKTTLLLNLLSSKRALKGRYDSIWLISPTAKSDDKMERLVRELEPEGKYFDQLTPANVETIYSAIENENEQARKSKRDKLRHLLIVDDSAMDMPGRKSLLEKMVITSRHLRCSMCFAVQKLNLLSTNIRNQADVLSMYGTLNAREIDSLQDDINISPHVFRRIFSYCTSEPNSFMHVTTLCPPQFFKRFTPLKVNFETGEIEEE